MGIEAPERAHILGHSVETNLKHYMFSRDKEYYYEVADIWAKYNEECGITSKKNSNGRWGARGPGDLGSARTGAKRRP